MKINKGHFIESTTVAGVLLTVEKYGQTGEVNRVLIGEIDVTELLEHVQDSTDFFESLESVAEIDEDGIYERMREGGYGFSCLHIPR